MLCPKCNTEIPEGLLYCPTCGEEIIIVSDFDIKLEDNIDTTVFATTTEIPDLSGAEDITAATEIDKDGRKSHHSDAIAHTNKTNRFLWVIGGVAFICVAIGIFFIVSSLKRYNDFDTQYALASELYEQGETENALKKAKRAIAIDNTQVKAYVLAADIYSSLNNYDAAVAILVNALDNNPGLVALYDRIVKCYEAKGDYESAHALLVYSNDENIMAKYPQYFPDPPTFSLEEGAYVKPDPVILSSDESGSIYYTTDGSEPTKASLLYEDPIPLEEGVTEISAVFFNEKGIPSKSRTYRYEILLNTPDAPILLTDGGSYNMPNPIGVKKAEGIAYYYTDNPASPTDESNAYTAPIFMPLGKSTFTFIAKNEDGIYSEPVSATYELNMNASFDKAVAEYAISYQLASTGSATIGNTYSCKSAYAKDNVPYYIVDELNGSGDVLRSFAVDAISGALYRITWDGNNNAYVLNSI